MRIELRGRHWFKCTLVHPTTTYAYRILKYFLRIGHDDIVVCYVAGTERHRKNVNTHIGATTGILKRSIKEKMSVKNIHLSFDFPYLMHLAASTLQTREF